MNEPMTITAEAAAKLPKREFYQFLHQHGCEVLDTMDGKVVRPAVQPKDYATDEAA